MDLLAPERILTRDTGEREAHEIKLIPHLRTNFPEGNRDLPSRRSYLQSQWFS